MKTPKMEGGPDDPWEEESDAHEESVSFTFLTRGTVLADRYEIKAMIGRGGMGAVYEAEQRPFARIVAVKVLPKSAAKDEQAKARFEREAQLIMRLVHPHIVTVHDFGQLESGLSFLVMERLRGRSLAAEMPRLGDPHRAVRIARQICQALRAAHREGIVHRDLKPANIHLIEVDGEVDFVKLFDFGIAKLSEPSADVAPITKAGTIGTPRYMAPEQALGTDAKLDHRADIYSLGCIVFEMLAGRPPFIDPSYAPLLYKHLHEKPPTFAQICPERAVDSLLEEIVRKALEKRPEDRFHSAEEMEAALELWASTSSTERSPYLRRSKPVVDPPARVAGVRDPERTDEDRSDPRASTSPEPGDDSAASFLRDLGPSALAQLGMPSDEFPSDPRGNTSPEVPLLPQGAPNERAPLLRARTLRPDEEPPRAKSAEPESPSERELAYLREPAPVLPLSAPPPEAAREVHAQRDPAKRAPAVPFFHRPHRVLSFVTGFALVALPFFAVTAWSDRRSSVVPIAVQREAPAELTATSQPEVVQREESVEESKAVRAPVRRKPVDARILSIQMSRTDMQKSLVEAVIASREAELVRCFQKMSNPPATVPLRIMSTMGDQSILVSPKTAQTEVFAGCVRSLDPPLLLPLPKTFGAHIVTVTVGSGGR